MEMLDLYDKDLRLTGETIERGKPIPEGFVIPIVAVFIYNNEGQYLIQKTSPNKGSYFSTTAGHVQSGEHDFASAMQRELKEELGLSVAKSELKLERIRRYEHKFTFLYMLKSNIPADRLRLQKEEVAEAAWMTIGEVAALCRKGCFNRIHYQLLLDCELRLHGEK